MKDKFTPEGRRYAYNIIQLADILPEKKFDEFINYLDGYKDGVNSVRASKKVEDERYASGSINK